MKTLPLYLDKFCIVYLDDVISYSQIKVEHLHHVKKVPNVLNIADLILNLDKCIFFADEFKFLGHIIDDTGRPNSQNIENVLNWLTPVDITEVGRFCNAINVYHKYIPPRVA